MVMSWQPLTGVEMAPDLQVAAADAPVLAELLALEPVFHAAARAATPEQFEALVAPDFWEIGASGRRYSRAFSLATLRARAQAPDAADWAMSEGHVAEVAPGLWLLTYRLAQPGRVTWRATLWRRAGEGAGWQAVFHQGTVVQGLASTCTFMVSA